MFRRCAEAHDVLDTGAVVPAAVEQDDLAGGGQVLDVALEVPLGALPFRRCGQGGDACDTWVEVLRDALDRAALARGVAALEDDHEPGALHAHPLLKFDQLRLEPQQLALVDRLLQSHGASSPSSSGASIKSVTAGIRVQRHTSGPGVSIR
ncbi:hypothetical protein GCM10020254_85120 [Streptomyces goshikiensis]